MEPIKMRVYSVVGGGLCTDSEDGQKVYKRIREALQTKKTVELSFVNIELITTAFFNTAIGQLYGDFSPDFIDNHLLIADLDDIDYERLQDVIEMAILFYKDPERLQREIDAIMGEES